MLYNRLVNWIYRAAKKSILNRPLADLKCQNCNEWYNVSKVEGYEHKGLQPLGDSNTHFTVCGKCNATSYWRLDVAPVAIKCNDKGET